MGGSSVILRMCEGECGGFIPTKRLQVNQNARFCVICQEQRDSVVNAKSVATEYTREEHTIRMRARHRAVEQAHLDRRRRPDPLTEAQESLVPDRTLTQLRRHGYLTSGGLGGVQ